MIASVTGTVLTVSSDSTVIDVNGVGMLVKATPTTLANIRVGKQATVYTSLVVREDSLTLYGFARADERDLFELLQTASGVGPRLAQAAVAVHAPSVIKTAIVGGDTATLTRIPGVGKKGAERLVLELKDRISALGVQAPSDSSDTDRPTGWRVQVQQGLMALGWSAKDASRAIADLDSQTDGGAVDVPALLKQAIRLLGRTK